MRDARVVIAEEIDPEWAAWLGERCHAVHCPDTDDGFPDAIADAEGLIVRTYTRVDADLLDRAPKLRVVGRAGVGLDNIDTDACAARGIEVVNTPDANTSAVAELVFAFMLDSLRPRLFLEEALNASDWRTLRAELAAPRELADCTLGILGLGRIGRRVARIARAFGMPVLYNDLADVPPDQREGAEPVELGHLLTHSDIITIHIDNRASNRRFVNADRLSLCRDDAVLINTSRGFVLDPKALAAFLGDRPHAIALLDVHEPEPVPKSHPLLGVPNAYLSPHIGAATRTAHRNMSRVVEDVWRALNEPRP